MTATVPKVDLPKNDPPIIQIYDKINSLFGNKTGQLFMMEFPGRILDMGTYQYDSSNSDNAEQTKPQTITEAEFRLSDDLFTLAQISGGPNGAKFTDVYQQILGSLLPSAKQDDIYTKSILPDQLAITQWLLEDVDDWNPPTDDILADLPSDYDKHVPKQKKVRVGAPVAGPSTVGKINRVDLYQKLLDAYENERFRWEQFKLHARPKDDNDRQAWDMYNRTLSLFAPTIDKKLEGMWTTVLVRGQYHRVRHLIGLVDVETSSETLLRAKENMRASVMRSIDDTEDIYPVQFSPASWASYLNTDFSSVDLLMNPTRLREEMLQKQQQRQVLMTRLGELQSAQQDVSALQKKADEARTAFDTAQSSMMQGYSDAAISLVQMFMNSKNKAGKSDEITKDGVNGVLGQVKQPLLSDEQFNQLKDMQGACIKHQTEFLNASEAVARSGAAVAGAIASDPKIAIASVQQQIDALTAGIDTLNSILSSSSSSSVTGFSDGTDESKNPQAPAPSTTPPTPKNGASEWESVTISYSASASTNNSALSSSASHSSWSVSLFFGSGGQSHDESASSSADSMTQANTDIDIGFNVMKVDINRPWFDGSILDQTRDFFRLGSVPVSKGPDFLNKLSDPKATLNDRNTAMMAANANALMPAFPIAFIIAKDVTLKLTSSAVAQGHAGSHVESTSSSGGGFLCFSVSRSSHESHDSQSAYTQTEGDSIYIRIPGPQIIGWMLQVVAEDQSTTHYDAIDKTQFQIGKDVNTNGSAGPKPPSGLQH